MSILIFPDLPCLVLINTTPLAPLEPYIAVSEANYIVTGDKDLLVLEKHNRTKIATITEFMKLL